MSPVSIRLRAPAQQNVLRISKGMAQREPKEIEIIEPESYLEVQVEEEARGEVIVKLEDSVVGHTLDIVLGDRSELELTTLIVSRSSSDMRVEQKATVGAHAKLHVCNATFGGKIEHSLLSHVSGAHSESSIDWIFAGRGEDRLHLSAKNIFDAPEGRGEITVKGVAQDRSHCRCDGMIEITRRGSRTDTYLTETMLMLDSTARCDAVPALEIKTNDVKASHSATVTKVSEEDLFYLSTRGIPEAEARRMFVEGFLSEILHRFSSEGARHFLLRAIGRDLSAF